MSLDRLHKIIKEYEAELVLGIFILMFIEVILMIIEINAIKSWSIYYPP